MVGRVEVPESRSFRSDVDPDVDVDVDVDVDLNF